MEFFFLFQINALAQDRTISGIVTGEDNTPIAGVTITIPGSTLGTITDINGNFSIRVPVTTESLVFSFVGMETLELTLDTRNTYNVILVESTVSLEEVVVVGYGAQKKQSVVGSIAVVAEEELVRRVGGGNMGQILSGQISGVTVMERQGEPGKEDPQILIRGRSTWNNAEPLILVDGVERRMNDIDIYEVASVSVLKDASATAVFGVKGANGVILITTKRGVEGKANLSVSANQGWKAVSKIPSLLRAYEAKSWKNAGIVNELSSNETSWQFFIPYEELLRSKQPIAEEYKWLYPDVDWKKELFKDFAPSTTLNINASGGTKAAKYFASLGYLHEGDLFATYYNKDKGYNTGFNYDRFNFRANLDLDITKTTTLSSNLSGYFGTKENSLGNYGWGVPYMALMAYYETAPDAFILRYPDGKYGFDPTNIYYTNPVPILREAGVERINRRNIATDLRLNQNLDFITKGLSVTASLSYDINAATSGPNINDSWSNAGQAEYKYIDPKILDAQTKQDSLDAIFLAAPYPAAGIGGNYDYDYVMEPWFSFAEQASPSSYGRSLFYQISANYNRSFNQHDFSGLFLFNRRENATGAMFPNYREDWVGRATYNYDYKYFIEFNGAYNGSEKFSEKYRFGFFPSMALGWMVSGENFMRNMNWIDRFKIRASIGQVGSDAGIPRWGYVGSWTRPGSSTYVISPSGRPYTSIYTTFREGTIPNPDIHWEVALKKNIGAEIALLNGLFTMDLDFFQDERSDIFLTSSSRRVPVYFGAPPVAANIGATDTKGYEIEFGINKTWNNGFGIWLRESISKAIDIITKYEDAQLLPAYQQTTGHAVSQSYSYITDESNKYMNNWDDVYASVPAATNMHWRFPGSFNIIDFNADGVVDSYDSAPYGFPSHPRNTFSSELGLNYKNISFMVQFYGVKNITLYNWWTGGPSNDILGTKVTNDRSDYWSQDNTDAYYAAPRFLSSSNIGSWRMLDGSYIRLKTILLSYSLPPKSLKFLGVSSTKIYINGNNLFLWNHTDADFETSGVDVGNSYPMFKMFNFGLEVKF